MFQTNRLLKRTEPERRGRPEIDAQVLWRTCFSSMYQLAHIAPVVISKCMQINAWANIWWPDLQRSLLEKDFYGT